MIKKKLWCSDWLWYA